MQPVLLIGAILLSSAALAEGGSDRALARLDAQRDTAERVMTQTVKASETPHLGAMVACNK
ncbi:hypothetical protein D9M71_821910 [compost metagenome]